MNCVNSCLAPLVDYVGQRVGNNTARKNHIPLYTISQLNALKHDLDAVFVRQPYLSLPIYQPHGS